MIQTVTGAIRKERLGPILMHEHLSCASVALSRAFGSAWLDVAHLSQLSSQTLSRIREGYGVGMLVDATPLDLGRNVHLLREVSETTGMPIVASTGFYYFPSVETVSNDAETIASYLIDECRHGMEGTDSRPGILKCATGNEGITPDNYQKLCAVGITQRETGLPMYVHCEHGDGVAHRQLDLFERVGADVGKIIIGHATMSFTQ